VRPPPLPENPLARWVARLTIAWAATVVVLGAVTAARIVVGKPDLNDQYFQTQDVPALVVCLLGFLLLWLIAAFPRRLGRAPHVSRRAAWTLVAATALAVAAVCYLSVGWYEPMTNDETMARFDAVIFQHGRLIAEVPAEWRPYVPALAWQFRMQAPDNAFWASTYLPVAAAFRALFGLLGDQDLANPFWTGLSVLAVFGVARRIWPQRLDAALLAAAMLATSAQVVVTGVSAFSMPAHLALNLVWLWLFLRNGRVADGAALGVGFLASGLHQFIFHPVFAAPFVLNLWLQRRWKRALAYTAGYGAIVLFWILYWKLFLPAGPTDKGQPLGPARWAHEVVTLVRRFDFENTPLMLENLLRFSLWQSLLTAPLALLALRSVRRDPVMRALALGVVLMSLLVWILLPNQGFGWGFRYLHGFIGGLCLLAAQAWVTASDRLPEPERRAGGAVLVAAIVFSAVVLLPLRLVQTWQVTAPYARAQQMIAASPAEVVVIDHSGIKGPGIPVFNDPFLRARPKVMMMYDQLTLEQLQALCARTTVDVFDRPKGEIAGLNLYDPRPKPAHAAKQALLGSAACRRA
jgi:hypothetical protein